MKRDAHYYALLAFCRACGFTKESAHLVAYASQFVDDARINLMYLNPKNIRIQHDIVDHRTAFFNMATCHSYFRFETFNFEAMVNNTIAFHFVPGLKGENFTKKLRCMEESPIIMDVIKEVFSEDDLIKLGIVLHIYVDTFSHQGFSGLVSKVNAIKNCNSYNKRSLGLLDRALEVFKLFTKNNYETIFDNVALAYGHAQALDYPDLPYLEWSYEYDYSDEFNGNYKKIVINNKDRYQRAFKGIQKLLKSYLTEHQQYKDNILNFDNDNIDALMDALVFEAHDKKRIRNWQRVLVEQGLLDKEDQVLLNYEDDQWLKEAFLNYDPNFFNSRVVGDVRLADDFTSSKWYSFYQATKWYKSKFFNLCKAYGLEIPN